MSSRHGNSRRQTYGRRMKDLRTRRNGDFEVDLEGPNSWNRGGAWDVESTLHGRGLEVDSTRSSARAR